MRALFIDTKGAKAKPWRKWLLAAAVLVSAVLLSVSDLAWVNQAQTSLQQWVERIGDDPPPPLWLSPCSLR